MHLHYKEAGCGATALYMIYHYILFSVLKECFYVKNHDSKWTFTTIASAFFPARRTVTRVTVGLVVAHSFVETGVAWTFIKICKTKHTSIQNIKINPGRTHHAVHVVNISLGRLDVSHIIILRICLLTYSILWYSYKANIVWVYVLYHGHD